MNATDDITTRTILWDAADLIEKNGWRQGMKEDQFDRTFCAGEAIDEVSGFVDRRDDPEVRQARDNAQLEFSERIGYKVYRGMDYAAGEAIGHIVHWNDQYGRTEDEVLATLRGEYLR